MEGIVKLDADQEAGINDGLHDLPERLQEAKAPGVCASIGDQD